MILAKGKLYDQKSQDEILRRLEDGLSETLMKKSLSMECVVNAMDQLGRRVAGGEFDRQLYAMGAEEGGRYKQTAIAALNREIIEFRIHTELGQDFFSPVQTAPPDGHPMITIQGMPLGILFHIAAGNVDGLPVFSLLEGLLTGNINILKLPQADRGVSIDIIKTLIEIEPLLSDFIYVFDTPSADLTAIKKMAAMADGIVVWGGDDAISAARLSAPHGARLIEWGHKLSFAYISGYEHQEEELMALAEHIAYTKQLLCSSCQTIFIDTEHLEEVYDFCRVFLPYLETAGKKYSPPPIGTTAEITLRRYHESLERILAGGSLSEDDNYVGSVSSLSVSNDSVLELSPMFGNCLVKRLPKNKIASLRSKKGYLQTAGLICSPEKRGELTALLAKCGVVRITRAGSMSEMFAGEAHDGEYPLRRYVRVVNVE